MNNRRVFLKSALAMAAGLSLVGVRKASAESGPFPSNIVYTADDQGQWKGKAQTHLPQVTVDGGKVTLQTKHPHSEKHFIVRHTVVTADGKVVGATVFAPADTPVSTYEIAEKGEYYATSFCNLHDLWVTKFTV
ncbi:desulfoferrodoxin family protein [Pseudodesulfovibrio indicus]|jgi:superoxide reductase|uniref:Desulfoferrodoxin n=1 Tax=Pseudodesulfovibrio indicus TaxID=1716143 RepID=A0A126QP42_9BACT|nr:desulfoferrodoxin family protein [Pseudodesulfovibrio indicus]AMK11823.1 desulfoferrodoxin [Pseudodesulfovibrio indicus]TDT88365.1 superoxide reductase [Pseudodesulfovibrio indicus]